ncbi:MAG: hypothetical protein FWF76_04320 [Oscillospiraceae bacterium]|nr:hypothetical protein [Oscillospiraceae bacterium]
MNVPIYGNNTSPQRESRLRSSQTRLTPDSDSRSEFRVRSSDNNRLNGERISSVTDIFDFDNPPDFISEHPSVIEAERILAEAEEGMLYNSIQNRVSFHLHTLERMEREAPATQAQTELQDVSGRLMARLVSAQTQFDVRWIIGEASSAQLGLNVAAAGNGEGAERARAYLSRIRSVLRRADRKLSDLGTEDRIRRERAVEKNRRREQQILRDNERVRMHNRRIRELTNELSSRKNERIGRESRWLFAPNSGGISSGGASCPITRALLAKKNAVLFSSPVSASDFPLPEFHGGSGDALGIPMPTFSMPGGADAAPAVDIGLA